MSISLNWHVKGRLEIANLDPENGGSITFKGSEDRQEITVFTKNTEWWSLFCVLPKARGFHVYIRSGPQTGRFEYDRHVYLPYLHKFLPDAATGKDGGTTKDHDTISQGGGESPPNPLIPAVEAVS